MAGIPVKAAIHTSGMGKGELERAVIANAVRVFNAGATVGLRPVGEQFGAAFRDHVQVQYSQPGTGKKYDHLPNRSSAPGQPPAAQTGQLKASVKYRVTRTPGRSVKTGQFVKGFGRVVIQIYTKNPYAVGLELGTFGKGKSVAERPAWKPVNDMWFANYAALIWVPIMKAAPLNFVKAERAAAASMMLANPTTTFNREIAAGR